MTQYGFYVDSSKCTGCKTCQVSCKDRNQLDVGPKLRRVYEYGGGSWVKMRMAPSIRTYLTTTYPSVVTTVITQRVWKVVQVAQCINALKMV